MAAIKQLSGWRARRANMVSFPVTVLGALRSANNQSARTRYQNDRDPRRYEGALKLEFPQCANFQRKAIYIKRKQYKRPYHNSPAFGSAWSYDRRTQTGSVARE